ncbi:hypothetical protein [Nocardia sp. NPDC048505]|uniref:hypothetical protein n=1 Tax=unclassified Nocardia TaxID=2637762 RepID=UPI0034060A4C
MRAFVVAIAGLLGLLLTPPVASANPPVRQVVIDGDAASVFAPARADRRLPVALVLPGANVGRRYYAGFASALADYGFVVVVAEHRVLPFAEVTLPSEHQLNAVVAWARAEAADRNSALGRMIDPGTLVVAGHSYGAAAALYAAADRCQPPFCFGLSFTHPAELRAVVGHGANTTVGAAVDPVAVKGIPVMFVNGTNDGVSEPAEARESFARLTGAPAAVFVDLLGANHFGLTDANNPPGAAPDPLAATTAWPDTIATTARWTAMWFLASLGDEAARDFVYGAGAALDVAVAVERR